VPKISFIKRGKKLEVLELHVPCLRRQLSRAKLILFIVLSSSIALAFVQQAYSTGQMITDTITSEALKGNKLGDPHTRNMTIYLPPGYASSGKMYPVIYLLHGAGGDERSLVDELGEALAIFLIDGLINAGSLKEMIIVMPDAGNKYGGSYYLNSELTGNYEDYIVTDLVGYIDGKYRTIRDRSGRAIGGASMGGYGAITLAMKHSEAFSSVAALSPPLGFDIISEAAIPEVIRENPDGMSGPGQDSGQYTGYIYALSAALSPNLSNPPFFLDLPFEYPSNEIIEPVRQRWLIGDPLTMLLRCKSSLMEMKGIYIDVGDEDLLGFKAAADAFHQELMNMGIEHKYNVYHGDHYANAVERAVELLTFLSALLLDPVSPSDVGCEGKLPITWGAIRQR
jgi:S-formylglutathione hydrolase FrmB